MMMQIVMTQDDIDEISEMRDAADIKDYLAMVILSQLDLDPREVMSPISTNHEVLH